MQATLQALPGGHMLPLNISSQATDPIVTKLLNLLGIYNDGERGKSMLIYLDNGDLRQLEDFIKETLPQYDKELVGKMQVLAGWVNQQFINSIPVSEEFKSQFPDPQPTLTVIRRARYVDGEVTESSEPAFQVLTPYNYSPKVLYSGPEPFKVVDAEYVIPAE